MAAGVNRYALVGHRVLHVLRLGRALAFRHVHGTAADERTTGRKHG